MKNEEKKTLDANKKGREFGSGNTVRSQVFLGQVKHSICYRSGSTVGKGARGDDFRNAYQ